MARYTAQKHPVHSSQNFLAFIEHVFFLAVLSKHKLVLTLNPSRSRDRIKTNGLISHFIASPPGGPGLLYNFIEFLF